MALIEVFHIQPSELEGLLPFQVRALCARIDQLNTEAHRAESEAKRG